MGSDGLAAVIKYLPTQFTQKMLTSKAARATYINTVINCFHRPFIWQYFHPGTIEIPWGEETYYDEVGAPYSSAHSDCY